MLDIGCGTGQYSVAFADMFDNVWGVDLSPDMLENARRRATDAGSDKCIFSLGDWESLPENDSVLQRKYDMVMAHTTPAVMSAAAVEKMMSVCNGMCYITRPTRRHDADRDRVREIAGFSSEDNNDFIPAVFALVAYRGYKPKTYYERTKWLGTRSLEDSYRYFVDDVRAMGDVSPETEEEIRRYLRSISVDGMVPWKIDVQIATVYWSQCVEAP